MNINVYKVNTFACDTKEGKKRSDKETRKKP
jgi:hypothetical protein